MDARSYRGSALLALRKRDWRQWRVVAHLAIVAVAAIVVSTWYGGHELVWGADTNLPLSLDAVGRYFRITDAALAAPDARKLPFLLPIGAILWVWDKLGVPYDPALLQRLVLTGTLAIGGIGAFWFLSTFLPRLGSVPVLGASLYYMFNQFALITIWSPLSNLIFHYCLLPWVLTAWLWALRRRSPLAGVVAGLVWSLTLTPSYITTPIVVTDVLLLAGIAAVEYRRTAGRSEQRRLVTVVGTIGVTWLSVNAFWIVPTLYYLRVESVRGLAIGNPGDLLTLNSVTLDQAIRLGGYWGLTSGYKGSPYFPWSGFYSGGYGAWVGLLLPVLALGALWQLPRPLSARFCPVCGSPADGGRRRSIWCERCGQRVHVRAGTDETGAYLKFFFLVLGVSLLLMTGPNEPFGNVKMWVMGQSRLFAPFRGLYQRFGEYAAVAYAPLVAGGLHTIVSFFRRKMPPRIGSVLGEGTAAGLAGTLAILLALPMWTGALFDRSGVIPSKRVTIPPEYETVARWIDAQSGDFTVLPLPYGPTAVTALSWQEGEDGYLGVEPLALLSSKPFVFGDPSASYVSGLVAQVVQGGTRAWSALRLLNVRYVVVHLDASRAYLEGLDGWSGVDTNQVVSAFSRTRGLELAFAAGGLRVYEARQWVPFRLFVVRRYLGYSIYALPLNEVKPIHYSVLGTGTYLVPAGQLKPGEFLVLNYPFDSLWRAGSATPISIDPGLTAFRVNSTGPVVVNHRLEDQFPLLLAFAPTATAALVAAILLWKRRKRPEADA